MEQTRSIGSGFSARQATAPGRFNRSGAPSSRTKFDQTKLQCSHCGKKKHTHEMCFELVGYPEWWEDNYKPPIAKRKAVGKTDDGIGDVPSPASKKYEEAVGFGGTARVASMDSGRSAGDGWSVDGERHGDGG